jgi:RND family efflux transporter MFP subunit
MKFSFKVPRVIASAPIAYKIGGAIVLVLVVIVGVKHFFTTASVAETDTSGTSHVSVSSVADLSAQAGPLSVVGTVTSLSEATILAQSSGEITSLPRSLGDHVAAGSVIGQFENSSQRAAVVQAQGAYDAAQASLAKAQGTTAANSGITSSQATTAAANARSALEAALGSTYAALDDAINTRADVLLINPRTDHPTFQPFTIPDSQLVTNILNERVGLQQTLSTASTAASGSADIDARATTMLGSAQTVVSYLNDMIEALNQAVPNPNVTASTIAADQTSLAAARTEVNSAISGLTSAKSAFDAASSGAQTAANSASSGTASDIAAAQASVKSAQGSLDAAQAALEKTIIRSPISGTVVSLPITLGDYVSMNAQVAVVSNPSALYVETAVTPDDAKTLAVGESATVNGSTSGVITFIAPAIDPSTGKIEVKVGLPGNTASLTDGETVSVTLNRATKKAAAAQPAQITVPIVAIKVAPQGAEVFTVSASSTLQAHPVSVGSILGDQIVVTSGLSPDLPIVTDARGLSEGQTVIVDAPGA